MRRLDVSTVLSLVFAVLTAMAAASDNDPDGSTKTERSEYDVTEFDGAIERNPEDVAAFRQRAQYWSDQNQTGKAIADYDQVIRLDPNHAPTYVQRALHLAVRKRWDEAQADIDEATRLDPDDAETWFNKALILIAQNDLEDAMNCLAETIRLNPDHAKAYSCRGQQCLVYGQLQDSIDNFNEALRLDPHDAVALWHRTIARTKRHEFAKGLSDALKGHAIDPRTLTSSNVEFCARALLDACDQQLAKSGKQDSPDVQKRAIALLDRGMANFALSRWDEAMEDLNQSIELDQMSSTAFAYRGQIRFSNRELDLAVEDFDAAIRLNPADASFWRSRGEARIVRGDGWAAACDDLSTALEIDPHDFLALSRRGLAWQAQNKVDLAIADYDRVISGGPIYVEAADVTLDAELLKSKNEEPEAGKKTVVLNADPEQALPEVRADFGSNPAWDVVQGGHPKEHKRWHAIRTSPAYLVVLIHRAMCHEASGQWAKALEDFQEVIRLAPADPQAYRSIAWLRATCPDEQFRNGDLAVEYASLALDRSHKPEGLEVLAAAHAEQGDFENAIELQTQAQDLAAELAAKERRARRAQIKAMEWEASTEDGKRKPVESSEAVTAAIDICRQTDWNEAQPIDRLIETCIASGKFDQAIQYLEKLTVLTGKAREAKFSQALEQYRAKQPMRSDFKDVVSNVDNWAHLNIVSAIHIRALDEPVGFNGIAGEKLTSAQRRLLSSISPPSAAGE